MLAITKNKTAATVINTTGEERIQRGLVQRCDGVENGAPGWSPRGTGPSVRRTKYLRAIPTSSSFSCNGSSRIVHFSPQRGDRASEVAAGCAGAATQQARALVNAVPVVDVKSEHCPLLD